MTPNPCFARIIAFVTWINGEPIFSRIYNSHSLFVGIPRAIWRSLRFFAHLFLGLFLILVFRLRDGKQWHFRPFGRSVITWWMQHIARLVGMRIVKYGEEPVPHALYVANHISFFDIIVISAMTNTTFISKDGIRKWPLVGQLSAGTGVVFIKRNKRSQIAQTIETTSNALKSGVTITVFPEGTTHFSDEPGKFHSSMYQAAIDAQVPIQAIALAYIRDGGHDRKAAYIREDNILLTLFRIMARPHTNVHAVFCPPTDPNMGERALLAEHTRNQIVKARNTEYFVETH